MVPSKNICLDAEKRGEEDPYGVPPLTEPRQERISLDDYFMKITKIVAKRSTCLRHQVGAILVRDKMIVSTGYNGAPRGLKHCIDVGCLREKRGIPSGERQELCRGTHAEINAIVQASLNGTSTEGATLYCTSFPCVYCMKALINAKIRRIMYLEDYPDELSHEICEEAGLENVKWTQKDGARRPD